MTNVWKISLRFTWTRSGWTQTRPFKWNGKHQLVKMENSVLGSCDWKCTRLTYTIASQAYDDNKWNGCSCICANIPTCMGKNGKIVRIWIHATHTIAVTSYGPRPNRSHCKQAKNVRVHRNKLECLIFGWHILWWWWWWKAREFHLVYALSSGSAYLPNCSLSLCAAVCMRWWCNQQANRIGQFYTAAIKVDDSQFMHRNPVGLSENVRTMIHTRIWKSLCFAHYSIRIYFHW